MNATSPEHLPDLARAQLRSMARASRQVAVRRLWKGARHPSWSFHYEAMITWLREQFSQTDMTVADVRARLDALGHLELRRRRVSWTPVDAGGVAGEWVTPPHHDDRVVLYLHGGAYVFGSVQSHRGLLANLTRTARVRALAVDYRRAPEHPCPAAIDDGVAAYAWLLDQGVAPDRIHVAGDSAGGGLTLTTLMALRDRGLPLPRGGVALSPWTDLAVTGETPHRNAESDYLGDAEALYDYAGHYVGGLDRTDPRVSPLYGDVGGLPPMLVLAGAVELIADDSTRIARRLDAAGVDVTLHMAPDEVHVYPVFADIHRPARRALKRIDRFLRR